MKLAHRQSKTLSIANRRKNLEKLLNLDIVKSDVKILSREQPHLSFYTPNDNAPVKIATFSIMQWDTPKQKDQAVWQTLVALWVYIITLSGAKTFNKILQLNVITKFTFAIYLLSVDKWYTSLRFILFHCPHLFGNYSLLCM